MLPSSILLPLFDQAIAHWHAEPPQSDPPQDPLTSLLLAQHRANHDLWHKEDLARDPQASDHDVTETKHSIDRFNQQRNDLVEQIDAHLLAEAGPQNPAAPLHSESPGLILDRLSILTLKLFHTAEEAHRADATPTHRQRNHARLDLLTEQRNDLAVCLDRLWQDILAGQRRFKLYRQFKMYNDPELNPVLYRAHHPSQPGD